MVINCLITCLTDNSYNPAVALADIESGQFKHVHGSDTIINHTEQSPCTQANDVSQHLYEIYPTADMNRTVVRCAVKYFPTGELCLGEPIAVIRYVNSTMNVDELEGSGSGLQNDTSGGCNSSSSILIDCPTPTPVVCTSTTTDSSHSSTNYEVLYTTTDTRQSSTNYGITTTESNTGINDVQQGVIIGTSLGTVITVAVIVALALLLIIVLLCKQINKVTLRNEDAQTIANPSVTPR